MNKVAKLQVLISDSDLAKIQRVGQHYGLDTTTAARILLIDELEVYETVLPFLWSQIPRTDLRPHRLTLTLSEGKYARIERCATVARVSKSMIAAMMIRDAIAGRKGGVLDKEVTA